MKRLLCCVLVGLSVQLGSRAAEKVPEIVQPRGGVANFCRDLVNSLNLGKVDRRRKILFFGNHFLYAPDYTPAPHLILKPVEAQGKKFTFGPSLCSTLYRDLVPGSEVSRQTSTTDTPSWNGAMHIKSHGILLRTSGGFPPDTQLVVLDFANNDRGLSEATVCAGLEGMLRQVWEVYPAADILFLYTPSRTFLNDYRSGREPDSIRLHEKVAAHYGLPSVNLAKLIADKIMAGELKEADVFLGENVISDSAGALCLAAMKPLFQAGLATAKAAPAVEKRIVPAPLSRTPIDKPKIEGYGVAKYEPGWLDWQPSPIEQYLHVLHGETSGPVVTVRFKGDLLGMSCVVGPDSGDVEVSVDGSAWTLKPVFKLNAGGAFKNVVVLLAEGLDPAVEHELKLRVAAAMPAGSTGTHVRIANLLVNGTIISEDPFKGMTSLQRIDAIYASLEPLTYVPPTNRWKHIPKTMQTLEQGPALTLVVLGDSIINDTCDSGFELLIGRLYPRCKVKKVVSVRSSTGCEWYKQENRVQEWVLMHKPDLLIIGGISNRGTDKGDAAESVREVVRQVRAARPETEFLLMTGPFGRAQDQDPEAVKNWQAIVTPEGSDYRSRLMKVAQEERAEFIDMNGLVGRYLLDSKYPYGSFQRDPIHANWRGKQVLGRILEKYFAPIYKEKEPMKDAVRIEFGEPVTVALAPPDVQGWGPYQFPSLTRLPDRRIQLSFHLEADSAATYGLPPARAVSADEGKTWTLLPREPVGDGAMLSWGSGPVPLPNGDRLNVKQLRSKPIGDLTLPAKPFVTYRSYGRDGAVYRLEDLPEAYRAGWMQYRLPAGATKWVEEQAVVNLPGQVRTVIDGALSFPWFQQMFPAPDGSVWAVNYGKRIVEGRYQQKICLFILRSTDQGRTWNLWSEVAYRGDLAVDPKAAEREGFTEPTVNFRPDGSVFCLLRTTDGYGPGPLYWTRSADGGRTWATPAVFDDLGVWPQMLTLENGVTLAVYGRPGLYIRATSDPAALRWGERVALVPPGKICQDTCSYSALLALDNREALVAYSNFNLRDADGKRCKGIQVRKVRASRRAYLDERVQDEVHL